MNKEKEPRKIFVVAIDTSVCEEVAIQTKKLPKKDGDDVSLSRRLEAAATKKDHLGRHKRK